MSQPSGSQGIEMFNAIDSQGNKKSSLGYYRNWNHPQGSVPDLILDVDTNGEHHWEGTDQNATFQNGAVYSWIVNATAPNQPNNDICGLSNNGSNSFITYKGDKHVEFQQGGWSYSSIYYSRQI